MVGVGVGVRVMVSVGVAVGTGVEDGIGVGVTCVDMCAWVWSRGGMKTEYSEIGASSPLI